MTKSFFGFRHRCLSGFEADLRVCAVAKRFLCGRAAPAKCHSSFDRKLVSTGIDQFHFARDDVRAVLDCFDFYVSHGGNTKAPNPKFAAANPSAMLRIWVRL